ncbi:MAG: BTAD domain-containing putative transcriptional regulator, partial [Actinomycetota bacterium]
MDAETTHGLSLSESEPYGLRVEFRVLGPLEASVEGRDVPLAGPKQRLVLAHLVVEANRVVPADRLIDHVWGEEAPEAARSSLQAYVSRLRRSLGADTIEARSPGYVLHARPEEVDAQRFERMAADARRSMGSDPAAAEAVLDRALALWRGPAFADLADDHSLQAEITRLEELRLSSVEDRIDAGLTLGHHADLIAELEVLVAEHPMRERLWAQLMLALYRAGRQGEALGAYRRARQILADELGIDPSPDLRRVHEQILGQDPSLEIAGRPLRGYQLFEEIGQGVVGSVHRGLQPEGGREVAVKVIHPWLADHPDFIRRFEPEAQRVGRLEHPHIVPQYDYWRDPGGAYLVMRYLRGGSLEALLQARGPSTPQTASALVEQIASALAVAHRQGVVHRDVRPSNVLFDEEGNAYLTDFSIIRDLALTDAAAVSTGAIFSLSPEEISGGPIGPATDVYGLGLLLYEVLAGRHPFADVPVPELRERHLSGTIPPISLVRPDLPGAVEEVLERATARDPLARYPDASSLASAFRFALEAGAQLAALPGVELRNPYKGLRAFGEPDTPDFFGREDLTARLAARLGEPTTEARFLAVVGPSGSGKSSAIRAGLIPAIRAGNVPDSEDWFVAEMHPGVHPFEELEAALLSVAVARPTSLLEELERDERGLVRTTRWVLPPDEAELLVVIDQFEELFTLMQDSDRRKAFLEVLRVAVSDPSSRVRVVVSLRADFYDQPLLFKAFGDLLGARTHALTGLSTDQLERAIVGPAERVGVTVEPRLVSAILTDVTDRPSALPLLQYALTELFERRTDASMTLETYHEIGRMTGALGRRAEDIFRQLDPIGKEATRQLFLRLVTVGEEGNAETRRRVLRSELTDLEVDTVAMEKAVASFDSHRLLSSDRDPVTRGPTVEVAHEALLSEWERLRGWIESAREDVRMHRRLAAAAVEWDAADRDRGFLFRGGQLERFEAWTATSGLALTAAERRFLDAGTAAREAELAEESAWRARESALERRSRIRLRALVAVFAVAALIASTLTVVTLTQRE